MEDNRQLGLVRVLRVDSRQGLGLCSHNYQLSSIYLFRHTSTLQQELITRQTLNSYFTEIECVHLLECLVSSL